MRLDRIIELIIMDDAENENGFPTKTVKSKRTVFVSKKSIRSNEFYQASQQGFTLSIMFEIRSPEYQSEKYLDYDAERYEIVRTYDKGDFTELICQAFSVSP